jgi:subtilase family serine protease
MFVFSAIQGSVYSNQQFRGHVPKEISRSILLGDLPGSQTLQLAISLPLRNQRALDLLIQRLYDPKSPRYRHFLTPTIFAKMFGPSEQDYGTLLRFLKTKGLTISRTFSSRSLVDVRGTVGQIQRIFHTSLHRFQRPDGTSFRAPSEEPSVDLDLPLLHISGLDDLALAKPQYVKGRARVSNPTTRSNSLSPISSLNGTGPLGCPPVLASNTYIGKDFRQIYLPCTTLTGSGQSVALFEADGYYPSDIAAYSALTGIPVPPMQTVFVDGFTGLPGPFNGEVALDIDMVMSMAPGASMVLYEAPNPFIPDDMLALMAAPPAGVPFSQIISSSWTWPAGPSDPYMLSLFAQFAAQGQSYFQASGDTGAYVPGDPNPTVPSPIQDTDLMTVVGAFEDRGGGGQPFRPGGFQGGGFSDRLEPGWIP